PTPGADVYFTVQPGGAYLTSASPNQKSQGAALIYPNPHHYRSGEKLNYYHYDPADKGWFVYGFATVNAKGDRVEPDPGVTIYQFTGSMEAPGAGGGSGAGGTSGSGGCSGDP